MIYIFAYHNKGSTTAEELYEIRFYVTLYLLYRWYKDVSEYLYGFGKKNRGRVVWKKNVGTTRYEYVDNFFFITRIKNIRAVIIFAEVIKY